MLLPCSTPSSDFRSTYSSCTPSSCSAPSPLCWPSPTPLSPALQTLSRIVLVIVSLVALVAVVRAGHTGAQVAWGDIVSQAGR